MVSTSLKIAFVLPTMPGGGVEVSMLRIASYLQGKGHQVFIFTTEHPGEWFDRIGEAGVTGRHVQGLSDLNPRVHARRVGKMLRDEGFQVVFPVFDRFSQAVIGMLHDSTVVIPLLRNDHPEIYEIGLGNHTAWNIAIGNSPKIHQQAERLMPHRPLEMIPNGVEVPATMTRPVSGQVPLRVVFVGRLVHESKGVLLLPEIMAALIDSGVDCTLSIAGDGIDCNLLKERFRQKGLSDKVSFLGMLGRQEVFSLLRSSHVFLLTSFYEGLPNVVLEAQANGCVPVATLLPGVTDFLVKEGETGYLVPPNDVAGFVDRISRLYRDPGLADQMAQSAYRFMRDQFSGELEGNRYLRVIEAAMAGKYPLPQPRHEGPQLDSSLFPKEYLRKKQRLVLKKYVPGWLANGFRSCRSFKRAVQLFVMEYVTNRVVAYIPSMRFRSYYYRRVSRISMDRSVNIQMGCYIYNSDAPFVIDAKSVVNRYCTLDRRGGLYIGSRVNVSAEVAIYTAGHDPQLSDFHDYVKPVTIEDYAWLGTRSIIMPGVTVGKGAVVLPGAIVTRNVEPYAIVGGTPARKIGERNNNLDYDPSWWPLFQ